MQIASLPEFLDALKSVQTTGDDLADVLEARRLAKQEQEKEHEQNMPLSRLLDEMNKLAKAKLGEERRKDMPQVDDLSNFKHGKVEFVKPSELKAAQETLNKTKVKSMANDWENTGKKPVIISKDNYIVDGHHRVAAAESLGKLVRVVRVNLLGRKAIDKLNELKENGNAS